MSEAPKVTQWLCCDVPLASGETARFWIPRHLSPLDYDLLTEYITDYLRIGRPGLVVEPEAKPDADS